MGRKFLLTLIIAAVLGSMMLFALQQVGGQLEVVWGKQWGTAAIEIIDDIALDDQGHVYIAGGTEGNLFGQNQGETDIFIVKLDSNGEMLWGKQLGSAKDEGGVRIGVDRESNIYLLTETEGDWFGKNLGVKDIVLLKLSPSGEILWGKRIGTEKDELGIAIAVGSNHVYIAGMTTGSLFGKYRGDSYEGFLAKYDLNGNLVWGKQFSGEGLEAMAIDSQSNIYVAGVTEDEATNEVANFLAKFNTDGALIWRQVFPYTEDEIITSISVDGSGNVFGAGKVNIYSEDDESRAIPIPDAFISKYRGENGERVWLKRMKSQGEEEKEEELSDVAVDGQGYVYVVGFTEGSLFGNHLGDFDVVMAKFDGQGNMLWGKQWGSVKDDVGRAIIVDGQGNIYVAGGTNGDLYGTNAGQMDIFIVKFRQY
jgi:hypothetical protein